MRSKPWACSWKMFGFKFSKRLLQFARNLKCQPRVSSYQSEKLEQKSENGWKLSRILAQEVVLVILFVGSCSICHHFDPCFKHQLTIHAPLTLSCKKQIKFPCLSLPVNVGNLNVGRSEVDPAVFIREMWGGGWVVFIGGEMGSGERAVVFARVVGITEKRSTFHLTVLVWSGRRLHVHLERWLCYLHWFVCWQLLRCFVCLKFRCMLDLLFRVRPHFKEFDLIAIAQIRVARFTKLIFSFARLSLFP